VGNRTYPSPRPNGLNDCRRDRKGVVEFVRTGTSESRRVQPKAFIESRKELDAIVGRVATFNELQRFPRWACAEAEERFSPLTDRFLYAVDGLSTTTDYTTAQTETQSVRADDLLQARGDGEGGRKR